MQESRNSFFRRFEVHANFQHFRSESYAQALQNMSALSPLSFSGSKLESARFFPQHSDYVLSASATALSQSYTRSAPTSPKRILELQKSSTLPGCTLTGISFPSPKKSSSSSLLNFFKKLSPKTRRSKDKLTEKPWIVVEFSQNEIEGNASCDNVSTGSDQSFELAAKSKENYFESLNSGSHLENSVSDDESLRKNSSKTSLSRNLRSKHSSRASDSSLFSKFSPRKSLQDVCSALKLFGPSSNKHCKSRALHMHKQKSKTETFAAGCNYKEQTSTKSTSQEIAAESGKPHNAERKPHLPVVERLPDTSLSHNHDLPSLSVSLERAQPPQTLSLVSTVFARKPFMEELSKMASAESIGACSLDVDRSESSMALNQREDLTASACSLKSASMMLSNGSKGDEEQKRFRSCAFLYITPDGKTVNVQEEISSVKLPSYLGISCAISGYKNYSRFCHSRENSPARSGPVNTHLVEDAEKSFSYQKSYSSTQNGIHSKQKFVSSQEITIRGKSPGRVTASVTNGVLQKNGVSNGHGLSNGHVEVVDACATKSLVQQRIESLFGQSSVHVPKMRTSRSATKAFDASLSTRSPSCPPQTIRSHSRSPPVFRHITKDFRNQLQHSSPVKPTNHIISRHPFVKASSHPPDSISKKDSASLEVTTMKPATPIEIDAAGYSFLKNLQEEKDKISDHIRQLQNDLTTGGIPEEISGKLLSAIGKANLLISQKFEQFRNLCDKNIKQEESDPFPTTAEDLAGFWDMVMLQVDDVNKTFEEIAHLRANSWKETVPYQTSPVHSKSKKISKLSPSAKSPSKSSEANRAREAQRQKLMEAKRKGRQQQKASGEDIAIFVPEKPE